MAERTRIIAIIGPESTGKTTLARWLAQQLDAPMVDEYAREYLTGLGRPYTKDDLTDIAKGQFHAERKVLEEGHPTVVCDTDLTVLKVWSDAKYGDTDPVVTDLMHRQPGRFFLLMRPDIPWEPDPLRENPHDRDELFHRYIELLDGLGADYAVMEGMGDERLRNALRALNPDS